MFGVLGFSVDLFFGVFGGVFFFFVCFGGFGLIFWGCFVTFLWLIDVFCFILCFCDVSLLDGFVFCVF